MDLSFDVSTALEPWAWACGREAWPRGAPAGCCKGNCLPAAREGARPNALSTRAITPCLRAFPDLLLSANTIAPPQTCLPPDGKYYAGSRRKAISPGCSYITVTAQCTPSTCERPTLSAEELAAQSGGGGSSSSLMPVIVGVSVGTTVLVLAILGGVLYMRKRQRDEAMRRKLQVCNTE